MLESELGAKSGAPNSFKESAFVKFLKCGLSAMAALFVAAAANAQSPAAGQIRPPTIDELAAFPKISGFALSPSGEHLAALEAVGEDRRILVWKTAETSKPPTVIGSKEMKIVGVNFAKDDVLAVTLWQPLDIRTDRVTKTFVNKLFLTDLSGTKWREPLPLPRAKSDAEKAAQGRTSPIVLDPLVNDPDNMLMVNVVGTNAGEVFKVNVRTNRADRIQRTEERVAAYVTDLEGGLRARIKQDVDSTGAYVATEFRDSAGAWSEHFRSYAKDRDVNEVVGFTSDPNIALLLSNVGEDKTVLYEYDVSQRAKKGVLFQHKFFNATGAAQIRQKGDHFGEIIGLTYDGPRQSDFEYTSPTIVSLVKSVRDALGIKATPTTFVDPANGATAQVNYDTGLALDLLDYSPDLKILLFRVEGPNTPQKFYLLRDGKLALLSNSYPDLDPRAFGTTKLIYYKARDGLDVPAFLTTPNPELCGPGPWKAVVHPHGGPWARDRLRFDTSMWVPLMSSRCMAVLQPQFRGSDGWGRKLWKAGDAEWGQKMQDDKDDGAKWMIDQKIAIPGRIAMFGFSYGGYSAFAASVRPNDLYKCAIAGAGVSDIKRITKPFFLNPFFLDAQGPTIDGLNPLDKADQIKIPLMIYHGERDQTVPLEQAQWFYAKAKRSSQPVEYHELADYSHGPAWTRKIFADQLKLIDDYLAKGCAGGL